MKIQVKSDRGNILIPIPTRLIFNRLSIWSALKISKWMVKCKSSYIPEEAKERIESAFANLSEESVYILCKELMRIKRKHGSWTLLESETADGEYVKISI